MELSWLEKFLQNHRTPWIVGGLTITLFLIANLPWQLDDYDQAKQAFTSFEMVKEGRWFYQQTPHEHVATKPPLVGWISVGLFAATRSWDVAWRLPSFIAAIAMSILLFRVASLGIFLLWVVGVILFQPGFFDEVVMREFVARFGETIHRSLPFYFYLPHLLHKFAPWSVLMIALAILDLRARQWKIAAAFREMSPETFWLLCWSLGGLLAMSLIPSKRVDRIFPVIPPLCLLLAAQIGNSSVNKQLRARIYRWSAVALFLSILLTGGYTIAKVFSGYRDHRDALVVFGREVRHEAETHHWRYEVIGGKDEGVLLYLRRLYFVEPDDAIAKWKTGVIDAVAAPDEEQPRLLRDLEGSVRSRIRSWNENDDRTPGYILMRRS